MDEIDPGMGPILVQNDPQRMALVVLAAVLILQFAAGNIFAAVAPAKMGKACRLESHNRWLGAGLSLLPFLCLGLGAFALRFLPDLAMYYIIFAVIGLAVGSAQGCVHAAARFFKLDPAARPFKAFNAGFALQAALFFIPVLNKLVLAWFTLWGFSGLSLLALGYQEPADPA